MLETLKCACIAIFGNNPNTFPYGFIALKTIENGRRKTPHTPKERIKIKRRQRKPQ